MRILTLTFLYFLFSIQYNVLGQAPNSLGFPSPNNSFAGSVGSSSLSSEVGVDLYTGTAQINIPICNLVSKSLNIPVSLNYIGGKGIKVQDYSSCIGLGWQLNAGGSISRVVRGFPDEAANGYIGGQWGLRLYNEEVNNIPLTAAQSQALTGITGTSINLPTADGEPDIFYLKTPYFSGQFTLDHTGAAVFANETGIKITTNASLSNFTVVDPSGNKYHFGHNTSTIEQTTTTLYGSSHTFTSTWYITSIFTFNSGDHVNFFYNTASANDVLKHYSSSRSESSGCIDIKNDSILNTIVQPKYLSKIEGLNGEVSLTYSYDRLDIPMSARLTQIALKSYSAMGTTTLQTYGFSHSYFGSPSTDLNLLRLKLNTITLAGGTTATATPVNFKVFTYNTTENLPSRKSQSFDFWGYYTSFSPIGGSSDPLIYPQLRQPNEARTKANVLTTIQDLTGATWTIAYDQNSYYKSSSEPNVTVGGLRVESITQSLASGDNLITSYQYTNTTGGSSGQILTGSYENLVFNCTGLSFRVYSEVPTLIYDLNGNFVGYSAVRTTSENGGYVINEFYNFSDWGDLFNYAGGVNPNSIPSITSSVSLSYKRGLLKSQTVFTSANNKVSEEIYAYGSLNSPATQKSWAYKWFYEAVFPCNTGCGVSFSSTYYSNVENYRLQTVTKKDYDQFNQANFVTSTTTYAYCADKRNVKSISTNNSKNQTVTKTVYHADDASIPMVSSPEQLVLNTLINDNNRDAIIHETSNYNGAITQVHNTYSANVGGTTNKFLMSTTAYRSSTAVSAQNFNYDAVNANLVTSNLTGGKYSSVLYGYNESYPIANIKNAGSVYVSQQSSTTATVSGTSASFTTDFAGNINFGLSLAGSPPPGSSASTQYTLTGPSNRSGTLCWSTNQANCSGNPSGITFTSMPAGNYTLSITIISAPFATSFTYTYPKTIPVLTHEFYFEGFEETSSATSGTAHTGFKYYNGLTTPFQVNFVLPNSRNYTIQWWNWVNNKWQFNEATYTGPRTINGIIDDVRIFPSDAQMVTYTYSPLIGKTGETDVSGRTTTYEYDGLSRLNIVRDNDRNILSKTCYNFAGQAVSCPASTVYSNVAKSGTFTRNNCTVGTGSTVTYTVPAGTYTSTLSQADADQLAINNVNMNGQTYANANGSCIQTWYNVAMSQNFTRNNCGTGSTGSTVTYSVAAGVYSSTISQADANQKAQNDINTNGQGFANTNGTCSYPPCSFAMSSGFGTATNSISLTTGTVNFYIVFYRTAGPMVAGTPYTIATINGGCKPLATRTFNVTTGGRTWQVSVNTAGQMTAQFATGTQVAANSTVTFSSSFPL